MIAILKTPLPRLRVHSLLLAAGCAVVCLVQFSHGDTLTSQPEALGVGTDVRVSVNSKRIELKVNSTKSLLLAEPFFGVEVSNTELIEAYPLSEKKMQLLGKRSGIGHLRVFDARGRARIFEVAVLPDTSELEFILQSQFPTATLTVTPYSGGVMLSGFVQDADEADQIVTIAEDFYPRVLHNIKLCGSQQVLLHIRVMEVSRTKLRALGFDLRCGIVHGGRGGHGFLDTLREHDLAKVLAEPTLVAMSGRNASFRAGGEFPVVVPGALGTNSIEYKPYGMEIDFVPHVLAGGRIRLEVSPRISEIAPQTHTKFGRHRMPSLNVRQVDTGVEMQAGQTLAVAGLIQNRVEAENRGIPLLAEIPYLGMPFRHVYDRENEVELLITVTPELIGPLDPHQVPPGGPGFNSTTPSSKALFCRGHIEVPHRCFGPAETVIPNSAYDQFLPGVYEDPASREVVDPNPFPTAAPVDPEELPDGATKNDLGAAKTSSEQTGEFLLPNTFDGLIGPVGYESDPAR